MRVWMVPLGVALLYLTFVVVQAVGYFLLGWR